MKHISIRKPDIQIEENGTYKCTNCGTLVVIDDYMNKLPFCPICKRKSYKKIK